MRFRWRSVIMCIGFLIAIPLVAQTREPPAMPYFKLDGDADKLAPAFNWWFELNPPPVYDRWWHEVADCERLPLPPDYKKVRFFAVNAKYFAPANEPGDTTDIATTAVGYNWQAGPEIWLVLPVRMLEWLVKHEMLHQLMKWAGEQAGHPPERFEKCGLHIFFDPGRRVVYTH
jgi:hypothetical protein